MELGWVGVTAAARGAAARAALSDTAGGDVAEIGEFGCQLAVTTLVGPGLPKLTRAARYAWLLKPT